jgi:hypothetical protein
MQVSFTWHNKEYNGELRPVSGAGTIYHLIVKNYYQGQLIRTAGGWQFSTQIQDYIPELAILFGNVLDSLTVE